ncbi:hypothetical protein ACKFKH_32340 [Phormidesmis sp. 146-20]
MPKIPADADDFEPGSDERNDAAYATAGTTAPVDTFIEDWGEYDEDVSNNEKAISWEHTDVDEPYFDQADIYKIPE